ncbi:efflux RND transporter permease subunit [Photobacterium sp. SDRW27]|uniref:efflux RND transporter permease subunit n=1 Tax=Photobacterium obscurum TaxID=2829490 RepID=UPI002243D62F|nr:efflux RND transporter permease subunit [Photobacterium obscurum]MCW8328958.1 efflux RND transporter permease subunit [Photobacterium obscurum]
MTGFIAYFARRSFLARIITIMVLMVGVGALSTLNLQEFPSVAFEEVEITTQYPGATAQDVEVNITNLIEKELKSVEGIRKFTSESSDGTSYINIEIDEAADTPVVLRDIQQAVDRVNGLPKDITNRPLVAQKSTSAFEVLTFGVSNLCREGNQACFSGQGSPDNYYSELQAYARQLEKKLKSVSGVGTVKMTGFNEREFWVQVDPTKVSRYQLTFGEVINAVSKRNLSLSGGVVESWNTEQKIVTMTQVKSVEELAQTVIKVMPTGGLVRLADVAEVIDTFERASQQGVINGESAILFSVSNGSNADIITTIGNIKGLIERERLQAGEAFAFNFGLNLADDMSEKFSIVSTNGGIGLILVLAVLSLILKRQIAFWVSVSIPFCVLGVMMVLPAIGMNLDSITLAALLLVIGIIVDDSVIVAESIYQEKESGKSALEAAISGTQKVIKPIMASLTTTALVFIPMFFIPGTMGKAIVVIPITVIAALLFSLAECTLTLPAHLAKSLDTAKAKTQGTDHFETVTKGYTRLLSRCIKFRKSVLVLAMIALGINVGLVTRLKLDIFPSESAKYIEVYTEVKPGTPLNKVREAHAELEKAISALPESELQSYELTYSSPVSTGLIVLSSFESRDRTAEAIIAELNSQLEHVAALAFVKLSVDAGGPPPGEPIEVRVMGGTELERDETVQLVADWLQAQQGLTKVTHNEALKDTQLQIVPQYEWLARYELTVADLASTLRIAFEGETVTSTWLGDQEVELRVIMDEEYRNIDKLSTTKIYTATGRQVPLSRLAKVETIDAPRLVQHYNGDREVTVTAQITDEDLTSVAVSDALVQALQGQYSSNVKIEVGGEAESTNETMSGFFVAFPAAMIGIYFVLAVMFNSLLQPLLVMAVIPFSVVAALMALFIHLQPLSLFGLIGVLGMTGVVVNNSLVLINRINELLAEGKDTVIAVVEASTSRLRPIVLTSLTTVAGLLPLAYGIGGTDVYMGPMSLTLGYGLLFSLPVVLLVIPCLYVTFFGRKSNRT